METRGSLMESNQMSMSFEDRIFNKKSGLGGGRMSCTLVTGFLGSGKTTLIRHILDHRGDIRIAVLVNEYGDIDVDSLLLNSNNLNAAFDLPTVSLISGCACCNVNGPFTEAVRRVAASKHNFDCLLIETSGLADPKKIAKDLEDANIHLDIIVTVVDAESLAKILNISVAKQQLCIADLILLNKCDLAPLGQISDVEDIIEEETGGTKVLRSQFCKVPLQLVIDVGKPETQTMITTVNAVPGVLSHESLPTVPFQGGWNTGNFRSAVSLPGPKDISSSLVIKRKGWNTVNNGECCDVMESFSSLTFESESPLSLAKFQSTVIKQMQRMIGLLRVKGILWFKEDRKGRFIFHFSGNKRVEALNSGSWETQPNSCLVLIGLDKAELQTVCDELSKAVDHENQELFCACGSVREAAKRFSEFVAADSRFKVYSSSTKEPFVLFGLIGSPLRGVQEVELNRELMRMVNNRGTVFLTAATPSKQDHILQLLFNEESNPEDAWNEIRNAAALVISKVCKTICPCRYMMCQTFLQRHVDANEVVLGAGACRLDLLI